MEIVLFLIFVVCVISAIVQSLNKKSEAWELEATKKDYDDGLARLRKNPNNASLRQHTLEAGRRYASLTRDKKGVTVFDEVALKNDIDAACAGAVSMGNMPMLSSVKTVEDRLATLEKLRLSGAITEVEYNERRKTIIDSI